MKPPPLPEETLLRVLRVSKFNGLSVAIIAGLGALLSLAFGDIVGCGVGLVVAFGGWTELNGGKQLRRGDIEGIRSLVRSQWIVLSAILVYCVERLASFDATTALGNMTPEMRSQLAEVGVDIAAILPAVRLGFYAMYGTVALVTLIYQGSMVRFYRRRAEVVQQALSARLRPVLPPRTGVSNPEDWVT